jgi:subtilisin-like proprotein convertase family protein
VQRIGAILVIAAGACGGTVYAGHVHIYPGNFNLPIPANPDDTNGWMTDAIIEIPDHLIISDLDVGINLIHSKVFDLQLYLQDPAGRLCLNMYNFDEYFNGENYTQTIFDDEAIFSIKEGSAPFTGRFRPVDKLSKFDGQDAYGYWHLQIYDAWPCDTGTFNHFELMITAPEPATAILLTLTAGLMRLLKHPSPK